MVFWMVTDVTTDTALAPSEVIVLISAWIPDSPVLSLPVIVRIVFILSLYWEALGTECRFPAPQLIPAAKEQEKRERS